MPSPGSREQFQVGHAVAASLFVGLAAALLCALGLFGGAQENVIAGVVLLSFAAGWALLAALSMRLTDQPQRWALLPAAVFAVFGAGLFRWPIAVSNDLVAWLWPIVSLALALWMIRSARSQMRSRAKAWLLYPVFAVIALASVAALCESVLETRDRATLAMDGRLVDVGGRRLFLRESGKGGPTVVLLPGAGGSASSWGWIEPAVARDTRVCVFDRAGRGWSDSAPAPQDGRALAADLHALLERGQVPGPYVLAGHSFGGLLALTYAAEYPRDVAGMVLLDSTHPDMFTRLSTYPTFYNVYHRVLALFPSLARLGIARLAYRANYDSLPRAARNTERVFSCTARKARSERDEWTEAPALMQQAHELKTLGSRPLIVLTAARGAQDGWLPMQAELARLSSNSVQRVLQDANHQSLVESQTVAVPVNQAIHDVVEAVRNSAAVRGS
jgi:pimeloyl-ACP methyl ester carboxylesterase